MQFFRVSDRRVWFLHPFINNKEKSRMRRIWSELLLKCPSYEKWEYLVCDCASQLAIRSQNKEGKISWISVKDDFIAKLFCSSNSRNSRNVFAYNCSMSDCLIDKKKVLVHWDLNLPSFQTVCPLSVMTGLESWSLFTWMFAIELTGTLTFKSRATIRSKRSINKDSV